MDDIFILTTVSLFSLCWGSFLASFSYRIAFDKPILTKRSYCPTCKKKIAWYDNIPILSWLLLSAQCRHCKASISWIYPLLEVTTSICITYLFYKVFFSLPLTPATTYHLVPSFALYFTFFSALLVSCATDLFAMVIPQLASIWLVPLAVAGSFTPYLAIDHVESMLGAFFGYSLLWFVAFLFKHFTQKDGLGTGDMELLCLIGAFTGPIGAWISLMVGAVSGLVVGGVYLYTTNQPKRTHIPFGPFLSAGAISFVLFKNYLIKFFLF